MGVLKIKNIILLICMFSILHINILKADDVETLDDDLETLKNIAQAARLFAGMPDKMAQMQVEAANLEAHIKEMKLSRDLFSGKKYAASLSKISGSVTKLFEGSINIGTQTAAVMSFSVDCYLKNSTKCSAKDKKFMNEAIDNMINPEDTPEKKLAAQKDKKALQDYVSKDKIKIGLAIMKIAEKVNQDRSDNPQNTYEQELTKQPAKNMTELLALQTAIMIDILHENERTNQMLALMIANVGLTE